MRRWTTLGLMLPLTVVIAAGCAQKMSSAPSAAAPSGAAQTATVEKPQYPGMAPSRMPDGTPIMTSNHNTVEKPQYPGMAPSRMPDGTPITTTTNFGQR
jgi:hypothetical protein